MPTGFQGFRRIPALPSAGWLVSAGEVVGEHTSGHAFLRKQTFEDQACVEAYTEADNNAYGGQHASQIGSRRAVRLVRISR
jgi:hypothetical protein